MTSVAASPANAQDTTQGNDPWQLLRALTLFRLLACLFFVAVPFLNATRGFLEGANTTVFLSIAALYSLAGVALAVLFLGKKPNLSTQVSVQIYTDIVFISLLMHHMGGVESGVGILLCASVSATALLRQPLSGYLFAAVATLAVLGETVYSHLDDLNTTAHYPQAAALCLALFVTSVLSAHFSRHRIASSALITDQQKQLAGLQSLSNEILRQFDHGLLAVTAEGQIAHSNPTALRLLGLRKQPANADIGALAPTLDEFLRSGRPAGSILHNNSKLYVTSKRIRGDVQLLTLVTQSKRDADAHQLKLATLGQWTAGVAHEIRNPLSAISQAAQLLQEQTHSNAMDLRLADIVRRNSDRIDVIVTDILNLARPSKELTDTPLVGWLQAVAADIRAVHQLPAERLTVSGDARISHRIDSNKLRHVIENLCKNSLLHGGKTDIHIALNVKLRDGRTLIQLQDNGNGIASELHESLFEPFYASATGGTGLGLFIAREICEQHQIDLSLSDSPSGALFELRFHNQRDNLAQAA